MTRLLIGGSVLVMLAAASAAVYATIPGSDGKVHACFNPGGQVRVIDADPGNSCRPGETALAWPAALSPTPTCAAGTTLFLGVCFEALRPEDEWLPAVKDCADEGRRLPTHTEALAFRMAHRAVPQEWTDHYVNFDVGHALTVFDSPTSGIGINSRPVSNVTSYRCVLPL